MPFDLIDWLIWLLCVNYVYFISQLCDLHFLTMYFIILNCVLYISQLCALYFATVCFIFLNCVIYISQQSHFYVLTVTQIRKAYRIFPIYFLFKCWKNWFFLRCMPLLICLFLRSKYLLYWCCSIQSVLIRNVNSMLLLSPCHILN